MTGDDLLLGEVVAHQVVFSMDQSLLSRRLRQAAAIGIILLLIAVFPANVQMALDWRRRPPLPRALAWARLLLQAPLVAWALSVARLSGRRSSG